MIYFLDCPALNRIKIGTAVAPEQRIETIRLMCPAPVELIGMVDGGFAEERDLHDKYAPLRRHGEWFDGAPELRRDLWFLSIEREWNRAPDEWRQRFIDYVQKPVFDNAGAGR